MLSINLDNNIDKEIKVAKRRKNHTIIALGCLAVTLLDMFKYCQNPVGGKDISILLLSILSYTIYVSICLLVGTIVNKVTYPDKIKITSNSVLLFVGFITLKIEECTISIEQDISTMHTEALKNHFIIDTPNIFIVKNNSKSMSFVVDSSEVAKINKN